MAKYVPDGTSGPSRLMGGGVVVMGRRSQNVIILGCGFSFSRGCSSFDGRSAVMVRSWFREVCERLARLDSLDSHARQTGALKPECPLFFRFKPGLPLLMSGQT
eukprot:scaffold44119_cov70-Cyclotella_meneghiniana.AAC.1